MMLPFFLFFFRLLPTFRQVPLLFSTICAASDASSSYNSPFDNMEGLSAFIKALAHPGAYTFLFLPLLVKRVCLFLKFVFETHLHLLRGATFCSMSTHPGRYNI
jgi:hypothetical protein